jgi:ABC-type lipoprotein release transport system permease subunit
VAGILVVITAFATVAPAVRGAREECSRLLRSE